MAGVSTWKRAFHDERWMAAATRLAGVLRGSGLASTVGMNTQTARLESAGFLHDLWFVIRNFGGAGLLSLGFGAAIVVICAVVALVLRGLLEAIVWVARLF